MSLLRLPRLLFINELWRNRELLLQLSFRAVQSRYRGSALGWGWSIITPLLSLGVYTFVFSQVFQARWGTASQTSGPLEFAVNLFTGLIVFNIFSEITFQAPTSILLNSNLVTKVVFPLELLPAVTVVSAFFQSLTSLAVLVAFRLIDLTLHGSFIHSTILFLPLVWMPLITGCLAISWALSAAGVFLRDLSQIVGVSNNLLMFLSAVFYPLSALPEGWRPLLELNPLVVIIEETRNVIINGTPPSMQYVCAGTLIGLIACEASFRSFQKARRGFADVL